MTKKQIKYKRLIKQAHASGKRIIFKNKWRKPKKEIIKEIIVEKKSLKDWSWMERFKSLFY